MRIPLGKYSRPMQASLVSGGTMTPTPRTRVPTPPSRRSNKGPGVWRAPPLTAQIVGPLVQHPLHGAPGPLVPAAPGPFPLARRHLTAPSPRRRRAPAAGPSPSAAEPPTPGARARCGDARPVSHILGPGAGSLRLPRHGRKRLARGPARWSRRTVYEEAKAPCGPEWWLQPPSCR